MADDATVTTATLFQALDTCVIAALMQHPDTPTVLEAVSLLAAKSLATAADVSGLLPDDVDALVEGFCTAVRETTWAVLRDHDAGTADA